MENLIPIEEIQKTNTYKELVRQKEFIKIRFLENKATREAITNRFRIWENTGNLPPDFKGINLSVVKDLIGMKQPDASLRMTCENLNLKNHEK